MDPHPDFVDTELPREAAVGAVRLTPLSPDFVDEDYAAVLATAPLLEGLFGDWPAGLTRANNLIDLAWHEREFTARRSFSWILRATDGDYMGCVYVFPDIGRRGHARAVLWLCDISARQETARGLVRDLTGWLAGYLPASLTLTWDTRPQLDP